jgi:hypothetical protein
MARNLFGGTAADVAEDVDGRRVPGAVGTVWDGASGGAQQVLDLVDADGVPVIQLVADERGFIPAFYGPPDDTERLWVDFGNGRVGLVSSTVGDRLKTHLGAIDPHNSRAYVDEQLVGYLPRSGSQTTAVPGTSWLTVDVPDTPDTEGRVLRLRRTGDAVELTRVHSDGAVRIDAQGSAVPLSIGTGGRTGGQSVVTVTAQQAAGASSVFEVRADGAVIAAGPLSAPNLGTSRLFAGPTAPANPQPGDVWVSYG